MGESGETIQEPGVDDVVSPMPNPSCRHRRARNAGWLFQAFRNELKRAGITPSDEFGRETFASITRRATDRLTLGDRLAGPGVWPGEHGPRR
jgi:hypothetical protein